jgi:hypothetical protein
MTEKPTLKKVEKETALLEKISLGIPGYRGYKQKEMRREVDKLIRDHTARKLSESKSSMREIFQQLVFKKQSDVLQETDRLIAKFDRVTELINHAPYGYAGFFNAVKIDADDLENMIDFDTQLLGNVKEIEDMVKKLKGDVSASKFEKVQTHLNDIRTSVDSLESTFNDRKDAIMGVKF